MDEWENKWKPRKYLADGQKPGFGIPRDKKDPIQWRPWNKKARWGVAAAYQQHKLSMQINRILAGEAEAADGFMPPPDASKLKRREALADHLGIPERTLADRLSGQTVCTARELLGMVSVAGIDAVPVAVADLFPPKNEIAGDS